MHFLCVVVIEEKCRIYLFIQIIMHFDVNLRFTRGALLCLKNTLIKMLRTELYTLTVSKS